ncbi:MAG: DUF4111 domain-containing protein [Clostridia bacterium]|nr:DUF4111 domain-containing protein [Clostridia bacterium]
MIKIEKLLEAFVARSRAILGDDLVGIYLHGSSVMGCFNQLKSDVDLIVVVGKPVSFDAKREFMKMTVELNASAPPKGIEMSIVTASVLRPFVYPTPYELHFSAGHLDRYMLDPDAYIDFMHGTDRDLAAHFTVIRARGRAVFGAPIGEVFGEVPERDYIDSIRFDVECAKEDIADDAMYLTLNLARVLAYLTEKRVLSKKEGGEWALAELPEEYRPLIRNALDEYLLGAAPAYDKELAVRYAGYMLGRIEKECERFDCPSAPRRNHESDQGGLNGIYRHFVS